MLEGWRALTRAKAGGCLGVPVKEARAPRGVPRVGREPRGVVSPAV